MARIALPQDLREKARASFYPTVYSSEDGRFLLRFLQHTGEPDEVYLRRVNTLSPSEENRRPSSMPGLEPPLEFEPPGKIHNREQERRNSALKIKAHILNQLDRIADQWVDIGERFLAAAEDADPQQLDALATQGAPVNYHDPWNGSTALHYVAAQGARPALRVLLKTGKCDFLARDHEGRLVSEMAGAHGRDLVMERLLLMKEIRQARQTGVPLEHIYRRNLTVRPAPPSSPQ
jgi:ankyrin repeat protein